MHPFPPNKIQFLNHVGLMFTYRCHLGLAQCPVMAGPHRLEEIPLSTAFGWLEQLKRYRGELITGITLTGGEPFYSMKLLIQLSDFAHQLGFSVDVVTNGFWATSVAQAENILIMCPSVDLILVNTDSLHLEHIPLSNIDSLVKAAKKIGRKCNVIIDSRMESVVELNISKEDNFYPRDTFYLHRFMSLPESHESIVNTHFVTRKFKENESVCNSANIPVILPDGRVMACFGKRVDYKAHHPLYLGNLNEQSINDIFDLAECNYVLHAIRTYGPKFLIRLLIENGYADRLQPIDLKAHDCDVCSSLFSNPDILELLRDLVETDQFFRSKVEYGRMYYLNEPEMVKRQILKIRFE